MLENNYIEKINNPEDIINKFGLKNNPINYSEEDALNYSSRIEKSANLGENKDILISNTYNLIPNELNGKTVLDLGCGEGRWSRLMADRGASVIALDQSESMIKIGEERSKEYQEKIKFITTNIENIEQEDNSIDFGVSCYSFNNLNSLEEIFSKLGKIFKGNGEMIISTKLFDFSKTDLKELKNYFLPIQLKSKYTMYTKGFELKDFEMASKGNGFSLSTKLYEKSDDIFDNKELNQQNIDIYNTILKLRKVTTK
jgi:ubiquinone/menaquinone biosynthesis C-methylase UbiE